MTKKLTSLLFISALMFSSGILLANAQNIPTDPKLPRAENKEAIKQIRNETKTAKDNLERNIQGEKEKVKNEIQSLRDTAKQKMESLKTSIKNEKDAAKAKIKELRISGREEVLNKFDEKIANIKNLTERVNAQIAKFEARGINTTDAKNFVAEAETKLVVIQGKITEINTLLANSTDKISPENKAKLSTLKNDIQNAFKDTHTALSKAIQSIKENVVKTSTTTETKTVDDKTNQ